MFDSITGLFCSVNESLSAPLTEQMNGRLSERPVNRRAVNGTLLYVVTKFRHASFFKSLISVILKFSNQ